MSGTPPAESPFWRFSLSFYARAGVSEACLALQDEAGVDVNLLLFLLFLAEHRRQVSQKTIAELDRAIRDWRESVVKPLRGIRRAMKAGIGKIPIAIGEAFRGTVKRLELESERIEQSVLEDFAVAAEGSSPISRIAAAEANLAAYAAHLGGFPHQPVEIILAAFAAGSPPVL